MSFLQLSIGFSSKPKTGLKIYLLNAKTKKLKGISAETCRVFQISHRLMVSNERVLHSS